MSGFDIVMRCLRKNERLIGFVSIRGRMIKTWITGPRTCFQFEPKEFDMLLTLIKRAIATRPDKTKRVEHWECFNLKGEYSERIETNLLKSRNKESLCIV